MTDHEIVRAIHKLMNGQVWSSDTLYAIADILSQNGYRIRDLANDEFRFDEQGKKLNSKQRILTMISRPEGANEAEVCAELGWVRAASTIRRAIKSAGFAIRKEKDGSRYRYRSAVSGHLGVSTRRTAVKEKRP